MTRFGYRVLTPILGGTFAALFIIVAVCAPHPRLVWNASASEPIGLYRITVDGEPATGDLVAIRPPAALARFLATRRYLPAGLPLLKEIAAGPGARVCRDGPIVTVNGTQRARPCARSSRACPADLARLSDRAARRSVPAWRRAGQHGRTLFRATSR